MEVFLWSGFQAAALAKNNFAQAGFLSQQVIEKITGFRKDRSRASTTVTQKRGFPSAPLPPGGWTHVSKERFLDDRQ
jgi:hypothetical protein